MQGVVFLCGTTQHNTLMLEESINVCCHLNLSALFTHQLLHALTTSAIEIVSMNRWFSIAHLRAESPHPVAVVPLEVTRSSFADQIAVGIIGVVIDGLAGGRRHQTVAVGN